MIEKPPRPDLGFAEIAARDARTSLTADARGRPETTGV
jgi:hypothetical protein